MLSIAINFWNNIIAIFTLLDILIGWQILVAAIAVLAIVVGIKRFRNHSNNAQSK